MEDQTKSMLSSSKIKLDNKKDESSEEEQQNKKFDCDLGVEDFVTKVCHFFVRLADASSSPQRKISHRSDEWFWMDIAAMKLFLIVNCQVNIELKIYNLFENLNFVYRAKFEHFLNTIYGVNDKKFTCHKIGRSIKAGTITALIQLGKKDGSYLGCELCLDKNSIERITLFFTSFFQAQFKEKLSEGYTTMNQAAALKILDKTAERTAVCFTNHVGIRLEIRGVLKKVILTSSVDYQTIKKMLRGNEVKSEMVNHKKVRQRRAPPILGEEDEVEFFSTSELRAAWTKFHFTMVVIHCMGSSHVAPNHGLEAIFWKAYENKSKIFKERYIPEGFLGQSGGKLCSQQLQDDFVNAAVSCAKRPGYDGQIVVLFLGTNDWQTGVTLESFESKYRELLDRMLSIDHTAILVSSLIPRMNTDMSIPNKKLEEIVRNYRDQDQKVRYVKTYKTILSIGNGNRKAGRNVAREALKPDGVHMAPRTVAKVSEQILEAIRQLPRSWFPDYTNY